MLRLILGRAGTGKTGLIMEEIRQRVSRREGGSILIVPEQYSHEAEREMARRCGDTMSLYAEVLSFSRLAHTVTLEVGGSARNYLDAGGRLLQLAVALEQVSGRLEVYDGARRQPERMMQLLSALDELRWSRADQELLREAAAQADPALAGKLRDLALLREALDAMSQVTGADPSTRLDTLADQIPHSTRLRNSRIYIDGFTDFTAQERQVIRQLWLTADVTVCLGCNGLYDDSEVFALSRRTASALREDASMDGVDTEIITVPSRRRDTAMGFLEENLFGWAEDSFDARGQVSLRWAHSAAAECELAAAEVLRLVRETGCRWRDIAIAVRGFGDYRSVLQSTFERYGIPLYASTRTDILSRPLPMLVNGAFEILGGGWAYEDVFAYLKTGLTGISRSDCDELENYVLLWGLRGSAWTRDADWQQSPAGFENRDKTDYAPLLERINALRRQVAAPLARLEYRGRLATTARGQCEALAAFWTDISLAERLEERAAQLQAVGQDQTAAEYWQLWEQMVEALEQCAAVLGDMPMDQQSFGRLFRMMLSQYDVGTIPVALDRVTAGDFDRMRRRNIRHLLVLGASDDRLPKTDGGTGLFTDAERSRLRELQLDLEDPDDALDREFTLIYHVLCLPSESLYMSRSAFRGDGGESRPSFVMERLSRLFNLREIPGSLPEARRSAPAPAMELACGGNAEAAAWFADHENAGRMERLRQAGKTARGRLAPQAVKALYGDELWLTASRIDNFASCKFQYFLRYGLKAKPRQQARFDPPEMGTFLHYILEKVAGDVGKEGGFRAVSRERIEALTDQYVEEYIHTQLQDFREKSQRFVYLFRRLTATVRRIVLDTARELSRSDFKPLDFELNFAAPIPGETPVMLTGVADRVDGWEHDGKLYLRIVDYKSGAKQFSLTDVWYGMGLQMLLYLFTLEKTGLKGQDMPIVPAGVLYVPARDTLISARERLSDEEILKEKLKKLRRSGLLLKDETVLNAMERGDIPEYLPVKINRSGDITGDALATAEQLGDLGRHVEDILAEMAGELQSGSITADPWFQSESENTCAWCDYFDACHFDEKNDGWRYKSRLTAPEFWDKVACKRKEGGETPCP